MQVRIETLFWYRKVAVRFIMHVAISIKLKHLRADALVVSSSYHQGQIFLNIIQQSSAIKKSNLVTLC